MSVTDEERKAFNQLAQAIPHPENWRITAIWELWRDIKARREREESELNKERSRPHE